MRSLILLAAAAALAAIGATKASAAGYTADQYPAAGTAHQVGQHVFTIDGMSIACVRCTLNRRRFRSPAPSFASCRGYSGCTAFRLMLVDVVGNLRGWGARAGEGGEGGSGGRIPLARADCAAKTYAWDRL